MPKFFVKSNQIHDKEIAIIGEDVNHIANVLRLKKQDEIQVCDKENAITYQTQIVDITKEKVSCKILHSILKEVESTMQVTIFQGLPKADKMEYIIQKSTELGGLEIVPVAMKRCIVKLEGKDASKKIQRWQKIAEVAAKQSGRNKILQVRDIIKFEQMKEVISTFDLFLVAYEEEKQVSLKEILTREHSKRKKQNQIKIGIVIGPEGGLEKQEVETLEKCGAKIVTLGNRILRTETVALAVLSNIIYEFE